MTSSRLRTLTPTDHQPTPYYDSIDLREYRYQRLRWGGTMGADYKVSDHSTLAAHFLLSDFKDWGDKWTYTVQTDDKPKFKYSIRRPDFMIGSLSLGGNHTYGNKWFTWGSSVSRSRELNAGGNPGGAFDRQLRVEERAIGQLRLRRRPEWRPLPSAVVAELHGAEHRQPG